MAKKHKGETSRSKSRKVPNGGASPGDASPKKDEFKKIRNQLGRNVRDARSAADRFAPDDRYSAENVAKELNISVPTLYAMEDGKRAFKAEHIHVLSRLFGKSFVQLYGVSDAPEAAALRHDPWRYALASLNSFRTLGLEYGFPDRETALGFIAPLVSQMYSGDIGIVCSSAQGLKMKCDSFNRTISERHRNVQVRVLMTDPKHGKLREKVEGRREYDIVSEIIEGITWLIKSLQIRPHHIRFLDGPPTVFCVFMPDFTVLNFYPLNKPAYDSWAILVRNRTQNPDILDAGLARKGISGTFNHRLFLDVFDNKTFTCGLEDLIERWKADPESKGYVKQLETDLRDELQKREFETLRKVLADSNPVNR